MSEKMNESDKSEQSTTEENQAQSSTWTVSNISELKEFFTTFDSFQRFRLETSLNLYAKLSESVNVGTSIYEKLVLVNGASIALSITFLGFLSSRFNAAHVSGKPHFWMITVSWSLFIASVFCCYRVIIDRHSSLYSALGTVSASHTEYIYQRLSVLVKTFGGLLKGIVPPSGSEPINFSALTEAIDKALKNEGETQIKGIKELVAKMKENNKERMFAVAAIRFTLLGVFFLCLFTILSLRLLF